MLFVVAIALTNQSGEILLQKRPEGRQMAGLWEFPGGKVERGETPQSALVREIAEELGVRIDCQHLIPLTFASDTLDSRRLVLLLYLCRSWQGEPQSLDGQGMAWVHPDEMGNLDMPPADAPFIKALKMYLEHDGDSRQCPDL